MNRLSLRNHWLKFETAGKLPITLEDYVQVRSPSKGRHSYTLLPISPMANLLRQTNTKGLPLSDDTLVGYKQHQGEVNLYKELLQSFSTLQHIKTNTLFTNFNNYNTLIF